MLLGLWLGGGLVGMYWDIGAVMRSIGMRVGRGGRGGENGFFFSSMSGEMFLPRRRL
jgi:hypothetical protein